MPVKRRLLDVHVGGLDKRGLLCKRESLQHFLRDAGVYRACNDYHNYDSANNIANMRKWESYTFIRMLMRLKQILLRLLLSRILVFITLPALYRF